MKIRNKNIFKNRGVTLIEVVFAVFIVGLFSVILISDFPKIQKRFGLSRASYKMAQDIRRAQNLGTSGAKVLDINNDSENPITVEGYGIYASLDNVEQYIIYADVNGDHQYDGFQPYDNNKCSNLDNPSGDCVIEIIDIEGSQNLGISIKDFYNSNGYTDISINFSPPIPLTSISNLLSYKNEGGIILKLASDSATKTVLINTTGLISVQ